MWSESNAARGTISALIALTICLALGAIPERAVATVITAMPNDFATNEASAFNSLVAVFTDDNPSAAPSDFTASIDWGDGSPTTAGTITISSGAFGVIGQHTYSDEGSFTATVTISDQPPGTGTATATDTATINEADSLAGSPGTFSAQSGTPFSGQVATFTNTNTSAVVSDFTATINWGDATTSPGTIVGGGGSFQVNGSHTYAGAGTFSVVVTLSDDAPGSATAQAVSTANVNGTPVTLQDFGVY